MPDNVPPVPIAHMKPSTFPLSESLPTNRLYISTISRITKMTLLYQKGFIWFKFWSTL